MTQELTEKLIAAGLTKLQASSVAAKTTAAVLLEQDGGELLAEANRQIAAAKKIVFDMQLKQHEIDAKLKEVSDTLTAVVKAEKEYGGFTDERARNAIALYAAILWMQPKTDWKKDMSDQIVANAGYVVYAYLGGQAKREYADTWGRDHE